MITDFLKRSLCALAVSALAFSTASAVVPYSNGNLLLGFRASDGVGSTKDYVVNLGPAAQFSAGATSPFTVTGAAGIAADLSSAALFGAGWQNRANVFWGIAGTTGHFAPVGADPARTIYATRARFAVGLQSQPWPRSSDTAQGVVTSKINALTDAYKGGTGTANNAGGVIQTTTDNNSYASFQPGGTPENSGPAPGISFTAFSPSNEGNFGAGAAGSVLDLYRIVPGSGPSEFVGFFTIDDAGTLTFVPDDVAALTLENTTFSVSEDVAGGKLTINVLRTGNTAATASATVTVSGGNAVAGTDYQLAAGTTVSFAAGETSKQVQIDILPRAGFQGNRTFNVTLTGASAGAALLPAATAAVTILETAPMPDGIISFTSATIAQPPLNPQGTPNTLVITVNRASPSNKAVSVQVTVTGGTLVNGTDYTLASPVTVNFGVNEATATLSIPLTSAGTGNLPRTITLSLSNPSDLALLGAVTSTTITVAQIGSVTFSAASFTGGEDPAGDKVLTVTVNRTGGSNGAASVDVVATGGTATTGTDFTATLPATVNWADGDSAPKIVSITIKSDTTAEPSGETILLALQNAVGVTIGTRATATVTIFDADSTLPTITLTTPRLLQRLTGAGVLVSGIAKDNLGVGRVEVTIDNGAPVIITPSTLSGTFNYRQTVVSDPGSHTLKVVAFDLVGNKSSELSRRFSLTLVRPALAGTYNGLITGKTGLGAFDQNGIVTITVTANSAFTARVTLGGVTRSFIGTIGGAGNARFGPRNLPNGAFVKSGRTLSGHLFLNLDIEGGGKKFTGELRSAPTATGTVLATISHADKATYSARKRVPSTIAGNYTVIFQADAAPNNNVAATAFPQGDGWAIMTVTPIGIVNLIGKLADGTPVAYSQTLAGTGDWPVHAVVLGGKAYINGNVVFDRTQAQTDASAANMRWFKSARIAQQTVYRSGWPTGITIDFAASRYARPGGGRNALGTSGSQSVTIALADGGFTTATSNDGSVGTARKVTVGGATAGATGANGLEAEVESSIGFLKGSFTHPGNSKKTKFEGVAYQKVNRAAGFFVFGATSGSVSVDKKP